MSLEQLRTLLDQRAVAYVIHEHEPVRTVEESRARLPFPFEHYLKTLVFRAGDNWILAALRGGDRIDYRRLAIAAGVPRAALRAAAPGEVLAATGSAPGAVCPIPLRAGVVALLDDAATDLDRVFTGATRPDRTLEIGLAALREVSGPQVFPLRKLDERAGAIPPPHGLLRPSTTLTRPD